MLFENDYMHVGSWNLPLGRFELHFADEMEWGFLAALQLGRVL